MILRISLVRIRFLKQLLLLFPLVLYAEALAADPVADATARFLAGMPVQGTPLERFGTDSGWAAHAVDLDRGWENLEEQQLSKIRAWAPPALGPSYQDSGLMYYMFSGPDFLYANAFFPNASTYVLCGIEPIGPMPDIEKIPTNLLPAALANLRKSLDSALNRSYFITKYMMFDLKEIQLNGTLPILYVFLARACCTINSVTLGALDHDGNFVPEEKGTTPGVKIVFLGPSGREQTLYYFKSDLADLAIKDDPGFSKFCEQQGQGVSLLKAACYLMNSKKFLVVRDFLLTHSKLILQDDSGIPFRFLEPAKWDIHLYAKADEENKPARLNFSFGYEWKKTHSTLMVATPK
jgi:hypothetical protein